MTLANGAVASGTFHVNVYGYLSGVSISVTAGITDTIPAETYVGPTGNVPDAPPNGFDSLFQFTSADGNFGLTLQTVSPVLIFPVGSEAGVV